MFTGVAVVGWDSGGDATTGAGSEAVDTGGEVVGTGGETTTEHTRAEAIGVGGGWDASPLNAVRNAPTLSGLGSTLVGTEGARVTRTVVRSFFFTGDSRDTSRAFFFAGEPVVAILPGAVSEEVGSPFPGRPHADTGGTRWLVCQRCLVGHIQRERRGMHRSASRSARQGMKELEGQSWWPW